MEKQTQKYSMFAGTFGSCHDHAGYWQPILAPDYMAAREVMFKLYGKNWSFVHTWDIWTAFIDEVKKTEMGKEKALPKVVWVEHGKPERYADIR
ncbi:MAG: hypothetical protein LBQ97_02460 [Fusobacteriaceae bacterium]|jgi:hypothetical protein|nr:hypothetical protein [Fusobacteriaceae bacterium]